MARRKTIDELKADSIKYEQKAKSAKEALEIVRKTTGSKPIEGEKEITPSQSGWNKKNMML